MSKKTVVYRCGDKVIPISRQKAVAILSKMNTTVAEVKRRACCGYAEHQLFDTGGKIKFSPYDGWYIRTYGCPVEF